MAARSRGARDALGAHKAARAVQNAHRRAVAALALRAHKAARALQNARRARFARGALLAHKAARTLQTARRRRAAQRAFAISFSRLRVARSIQAAARRKVAARELRRRVQLQLAVELGEDALLQVQPTAGGGAFGAALTPADVQASERGFFAAARSAAPQLSEGDRCVSVLGNPLVRSFVRFGLRRCLVASFCSRVSFVGFVSVRRERERAAECLSHGIARRRFANDGPSPHVAHDVIR